MEAIPIGIFWCLALWACLQRRHALVYLFFATMPFGSFAALPTAMTGGLTLTPTPIVALLMVMKEFSSRHGMRSAVASALRPSGLLLLTLFWTVACVATVFMPRFFAGQVEVVPVRSVGLFSTSMLFPTAQNISQMVYTTVSVLTVFAFSRILRDHDMRQHALAALCLGATVTILTGLVDLVSQSLSLQSALEVFRTASYTLLTEDEVMGSKRIVGLMPEASSFGGLLLGYLAAVYYFRRAMPLGWMRDRLAPVLIGALLLLVWLSTSSSAYLGLALFGATLVAEWCWRLVAAGRNPYLRRGIGSEFWLGMLGLGLLLLVVIAAPEIFAPVIKMVDLMVFQKSSTSSFEERSMWTKVSWNALLSTHGLGVGMGGTRASNFAVALASNAGFLGAGLYVLFVVHCLLVRRAPQDDLQGAALLSACRWAYLPAFCASLTVGTTPDFGLFNAFLYGFAAAVAYRGKPARLPAAVTQRDRSRSSSRQAGSGPVPSSAEALRAG